MKLPYTAEISIQYLVFNICVGLPSFFLWSRQPGCDVLYLWSLLNETLNLLCSIEHVYWISDNHNAMERRKPTVFASFSNVKQVQVSSFVCSISCL